MGSIFLLMAAALIAAAFLAKPKLWATVLALYVLAWFLVIGPYSVVGLFVLLGCVFIRALK